MPKSSVLIVSTLGHAPVADSSGDDSRPGELRNLCSQNQTPTPSPSHRKWPITDFVYPETCVVRGEGCLMSEGSA